MQGNGFKEIRMVRIADLIKNAAYQRALNERRAQTIADNFNPEIFDPITVVERPGGKWAVIDGATRARAAELAGYDEIPATVSLARTVRDEAELFSDKNSGQKSLTAIERFEADVLAGREDAVAIQEMLDEIGWTVRRQARGIKALRSAYARSGGHVTGRALRILAKVFEGHDRVPSRLIIGTITFLALHSEARDRYLQQTLSQKEKAIERDLDSRGEQGSGGRPMVASASICHFYNERLRSGRLHSKNCLECMTRDLIAAE